MVTLAAPPSHVAVAEQYARDVVAGDVVACKWVKLACQRHLDDLERQETDWPFYFDEASASKVCRAIEKFPHVKGKWDSDLIVLQPWQTFVLCVVFGWLRKDDNMRRFRTVYIEVPRKNTKSTLSAAVALAMLTIDGETGAEVYSAATTRDQAKIVFTVAQDMARRSPDFREAFGLQVNAHNLSVLQTGSKFEPLSAEANSLDGLNLHFGAIDELHAHKTREVFDVLETATGARLQPLLWCITTAGSNRSGVCYEQRTYLTKILERVTTDDTYFGVIYTIDEGDDWTDPAVWAKANPSYGVSVYPDDIQRLCDKAQTVTSALNNFLTKRLNVWVNADTAWMDMAAWDKCADASLTPDMFAGEECYIGVDLASKVDIAAAVTLFQRDDHIYAFGKYYLPQDTAEASGNSQYSGWARDGLLTITPGNVIDFDYIEADMDEQAGVYEIREVPFDPFQATQFSTRMMGKGFAMVEMRPTVLNFSEPMKQLDALVRSGKFHHNGDPVLTWMASNVVAHTDVKDNIYPRKERPENKIDGIVALLMALGRAMANEGTDTRSIYETRGVLTT